MGGDMWRWQANVGDVWMYGVGPQWVDWGVGLHLNEEMI